MRALSILFLALTACSQGLNIACDKDDHTVDPDITDMETDLPAADTDELVDTDVPVAADVPDVLRVSFTTAFGPIGYARATAGTRINLGGIMLENMGDEPIHVSSIPLPLGWDDGDDGFPEFDRGEYDVLNNCTFDTANGPAIQLAGPVDLTVASNGWERQIVFAASLNLAPGTTTVANVNCDGPRQPLDHYVAVAIDVPYDQIKSDADSIEYGDFNGLPSPSRATVLPYVDSNCMFYEVPDTGNYSVTSGTRPGISYPAPWFGTQPRTTPEWPVDISSIGGCGDLQMVGVRMDLREIGPIDYIDWIDGVVRDHASMTLTVYDDQGTLTSVNSEPFGGYSGATPAGRESNLIYEWWLPGFMPGRNRADLGSFTIDSQESVRLNFNLGWGLYVPNDGVHQIKTAITVYWRDPVSGITFTQYGETSRSDIVFHD